MLNSVTFAGLEFEHPLMNSGGTCKTLEDVERFARSAVSAVLVNMLVAERSGNEGDTYWSDGQRSLNSKGLPSPGELYYRQNMPQMVEIVHTAGKKIGVNISGFEPWEYARLARIAADAGVDFIELNFGCPNLWEGSSQKAILSFYPEGIKQVLRLVANQGITIPVIVKFSPFSDPGMVDVMCGTLSDCAASDEFVKVSGSTHCNTFPNALMFNPKTGNAVISVASGLAGMAGKALLPIALGQVKQFQIRHINGDLPDYFEFIGSGGVTCVQDISYFRIAGATLVQAATPYFDAGEVPGAYSDIMSR